MRQALKSHNCTDRVKARRAWAEILMGAGRAAKAPAMSTWFGLQFRPGEDLYWRHVPGLAESEVVVKIEGAITIEHFANDCARHRRMAVGGKRGVRGVNEAGEKGAIIQAE